MITKFKNMMRRLFKVRKPSKEVTDMINLWNGKMGGN